MASAADPFNGTTPLSASWTTVTGAASCVGGVCTGSSFPWIGTWNATSFTADQLVTITLQGLVDTDLALARFNGGTFSGYALRVATIGGGTVGVLRIDGGVIGATIFSTTGVTQNAGDVFGIRAVATSLRAERNGVDLGGGTDSTYTTAQRPGVSLTVAGDTVTDWTADDVVAATAGGPAFNGSRVLSSVAFGRSRLLRAP